MELTDEEIRFLAKRRRLVRTWPLVGGVLLCLVAGLCVWLVLAEPLLGNPFEVAARLKADAIPDSMLYLMAGLLPIVVQMCLVLAVAIVLFVYASVSNEKKYLALVQRSFDPKAAD